MFTDKQIEALRDFGFFKVNTSAYSYQNLMILTFGTYFKVVTAGDKILTIRDPDTFENILKFIEEFNFLLFTKKQIEVLTSMGFSRKEDNKYIRIIGRYRIIVFCYEDSYVISWMNDDWKNTQDFKTFAETADFLLTLN